MKVKVKFDVSSVKKWLMEHGEKVAFGVMAVVFLLFTYSALRQEVLDDTKQPEALKKMANQVQSHVAGSTWDQSREGLQLVDYDKRAQRELISDKSFPLSVPFNNPLADEKTKRGMPQLLPVEDLRVAAGTGIFSLAPEAGGPGSGGGGDVKVLKGAGLKPSNNARLKSQCWAVITALVPYDKQAAEYSRVFSHAMSLSKEAEVPRYANVIVERAEIDRAHPDQLDWKKLPREDVQAFEKQWEAALPDVVGKDYIDKALTYPLGPLVGVGWDASVSNPKIPLAQSVANQPAGAPAGGKPAAEAPQAPPAEPKAAEYRLLRVFDYSVEPDHKYRYRVTVALANPNYQLGPQYLEKPDLATQQYLEIGPSAPTEPVAIPRGHRVLAGTVKPLRGNAEPQATLMLIAVDEKQGIEASTELPVSRGTLANVLKPEVFAKDPRNGKVVPLEDVNFKSGFVVLDIHGGKVMKKETSPGEMLLLDEYGNLIVRDELEDQSAYELSKPPEAPDDSSPRGAANPEGPARPKKTTARPAGKSGR